MNIEFVIPLILTKIAIT